MPAETPPTPRLVPVDLPAFDDDDAYFLAEADARDVLVRLPSHGLLFAPYDLNAPQPSATLDPALAMGLCYDLRLTPHTARRADRLAGSLGLFIQALAPSLTDPFPFASPATEPPASLLVVEMAPFGQIHIVPFDGPIVSCGDVLAQMHEYLWWPLPDPTAIPDTPLPRIINAHQERTQTKPDLMRRIDALAGKTALLGLEPLQGGTRWSARLCQA